MFLCDFHTHTYFSFDGDRKASPDAMCRSAIEKGITDLALTDHFEANSNAEGNISPYDAKAAHDEILLAKDKYKDSLNLVYGIELGQGYQYPDEVNKLFKDYKFDFVIGSLHNLRYAPDFCYLDFSEMPYKYAQHLFSRYIDEINETVDAFDCIDTVGHLTYMQRYTALAGINFDFRPYYDRLAAFFDKIIFRDIALEVNVSTLRKGLGFSMPDADILRLYRDRGGKLITVGSDAHSPADLGSCIADGFRLLESIGFDRVMVVKNREKVLCKI